MPDKYWILIDETPHNNWGGLSCEGLFESRESALLYIETFLLGNRAKDIVWEQPENNPDFWDGWLRTTTLDSHDGWQHWVLYTEKVTMDEEVLAW